MEDYSCKVSIVIKALNEEENIAKCIESALKAVQEVGGEVILADSLSTDKTIEIAQKYPIKIIQLVNSEERCCGIGPQLGYQIAEGEFVYILDGDMQMLEGFLIKAVDFLQKNSSFAGVGGKVIEMNQYSLEFLSRVERGDEHMAEGEVDRLDMGGLYRKEAIAQVGYFSNRNLHSYEELDLAVRLRSKGWKLQRINFDAVRHWGHDIDAYALLLKRWKSGYIMGLGEVLRAAFGKPHFRILWASVREARIYLAVIFWWLFLIMLIVSPQAIETKLFVFITALLIPVFLMSAKKKSFRKALYSVVSWNFNALGMIKGFFLSSRAASKSIDHQRLD